MINPYESPQEASTAMPPKKPRFTFTRAESLVVLAIVGVLLFGPPFGSFMQKWREQQNQERWKTLPVAHSDESGFHEFRFAGNPSPDQS